MDAATKHAKAWLKAHGTEPMGMTDKQILDLYDSWQTRIPETNKVDDRPAERNPDATAHYLDGVRAALTKVQETMPSRYRGVVTDVARTMGVEL